MGHRPQETNKGEGRSVPLAPERRMAGVDTRWLRGLNWIRISAIANCAVAGHANYALGG